MTRTFSKPTSWLVEELNGLTKFEKKNIILSVLVNYKKQREILAIAERKNVQITAIS